MSARAVGEEAGSVRSSILGIIAGTMPLGISTTDLEHELRTSTPDDVLRADLEELEAAALIEEDLGMWRLTASGKALCPRAELSKAAARALIAPGLADVRARAAADAAFIKRVRRESARRARIEKAAPGCPGYAFGGMDELRGLVAAFSSVRESFLDAFQSHDLLKLYRAMRASRWDVYPDDWEPRQVLEALRGIAPEWDPNCPDRRNPTGLRAKYEASR